MKHFFVISSHITFLIAKSIQKYLEISDQASVFIKIRNYEHAELSLNNVIDFTDIDIDLNNSKFIQLNKKVSTIKQIDLRIENNVGNASFTAYIPHVATSFMQSLITHKNCHKIAIIEEGTLAYCNSNFKTPSRFSLKEIIRLIANVKMPGRRLYKLKPFDLSIFKQTPEFFALTNIAFENCPFKVTVVPLMKLADTEYSVNHKDSLLLLDAAVEFGHLKFETFKKAITTILDDIDCTHLHIKYHPDQRQQTIDMVENSCQKKGIKFSVIPRNISIEQLISCHKLYEIIGFSTSLLLYGTILKQNVTSYEYLLLKDLGYQQKVNSLDFNLANILERLTKIESDFL